jgi:hypothetical protein
MIKSIIKPATGVKSVREFLFYCISTHTHTHTRIYVYTHTHIDTHTHTYVYIYISLHTKFAAVACLQEGQFLPAMENSEVSNIMAQNHQINIIKQGRTKL